jgi:hypothetical protein
MTAFTDSYGFNKGSTAYPSTYTNRFTVVEIDLDFAKIAAARSAAGVAALASTDTLVLCTLRMVRLVLLAVMPILRLILLRLLPTCC